MFSIRDCCSSAIDRLYSPASLMATMPNAPPTAATRATAARTMATAFITKLLFIYRPPSIL